MSQEGARTGEAYESDPHRVGRVGFTDLILRAVRGENMFAHARIPETVPADVASFLEKGVANEAAFEANLENWVAQRRKH